MAHVRYLNITDTIKHDTATIVPLYYICNMSDAADSEDFQLNLGGLKFINLYLT